MKIMNTRVQEKSSSRQRFTRKEEPPDVHRKADQISNLRLQDQRCTGGEMEA